ncbi:MAG: precorrin-2 C(20)-methyltransferase [Lachnospiraceae bacterium]|nr:precorrin-2 C(20)-methyltransferase [Lachnospiraceae bacterium]
MEKGILYGVGVGPGDPELLTLKAIKTIKENDVIAVAGATPEESAAYRIVKEVVPEIAEKTVISTGMPMTRDKVSLRQKHAEVSKHISGHLISGKNVVFLTLGDPSIYSTFSYIRSILSQEGYDIEIIPGVSSISAVTARLGISLADWDEEVYILPAGQKDEIGIKNEGTYVLMKPRGSVMAFKDVLRSSGRNVKAISNCGLKNEVIYGRLEDIPDEIPYMTVFVVK